MVVVCVGGYTLDYYHHQLVLVLVLLPSTHALRRPAHRGSRAQGRGNSTAQQTLIRPTNPTHSFAPQLTTIHISWPPGRVRHHQQHKTIIIITLGEGEAEKHRHCARTHVLRACCT